MNRVGHSVVAGEETDAERLEAAALWFAQLEDNVADLAAFESWRAVPANALAFIRVSGSADWLDQHKHTLPASALKARRPSLGRRDLLIAAGIGLGALAIGGGALWMLFPARAMAETGIGQRSSLSLPDGGRVDVNTDSKVSWRYANERQDVWLERGEILLTVPKDSRRVRLHAGNHEIELDPGRFDLRVRPAGVQISVLEGACRMAPTSTRGVQKSGGAISSGSAATIENGNLVVRTLSADEQAAVSAWQNDEIVFDGETLADAVADYNRYLKRKIEIKDASLLSVQIGGRFTTQNPSEFLSALRTSFGLRVIDTGAGVIQIGR